MSRVLIVANRLPVSIERRQGAHVFRRSVGGVATGLGSLRAPAQRLWVGWAEVSSRLDAAERETLRSELRESYDCEPVFLTADDVATFYHGFSNRTLWPLLHYFARFAEFDERLWHGYERVNRKFRDAVLDVYEPGDRIWIQDYHLMLLPSMLRERLPDASIGFFLHVPFPSWELFRLLPWRRELAEGLLGASLIGFHTHDYVRHFLGTVRSTLGLEDRTGRLVVDGRLVLVDAFPMGIDFERYASGGRRPAARRERKRVLEQNEGCMLVLSIDRLDYTKGIPERLQAFDAFLEEHPEWRGRVTMVCVAVPSRSRVEEYRRLKREVDGLVGSINGRWATIEWTPIRYLYRSLSFNALLGLYAAADVCLVTPLRDGMNLIAKEYVAVHSDGPGVLVLSEMAGAARELTEAVVVNPHDRDRMVESIAEALEMDPAEQRRRNALMRLRLERYDVTRWAEDFLGRLEEVAMLQLAFGAYELNREARARLREAYASAEKRLLLLDYDGTLMPYDPEPDAVAPDARLRTLLRKLSADERNTLVVISGRDAPTMDRWLGGTGVTLVAEHGVWLREPGREWGTLVPLSNEWRERIMPVLQVWVDRTPGSFVEEKEFSLAWHYRRVPADLARRRLEELQETLAGQAGDLGLQLLEGNKVLEVKSAGVDKGGAAYRWMGAGDYAFMCAIGDDATDEDMFEAAPTGTWTIKVGAGPSRAAYALSSVADVRRLLLELARVGARLPVHT